MRRIASILIAVVLLLLAIGIVMLASTSSVKGASAFDDPHHFVRRQVLWLFISGLVGTVVAFFDYHWWRRLAVPMALAALVLLVLVFVPGIGVRAGGSSRWLRLGPMTVQPSELTKFAGVVGLAAWMARVGRRSERLVEGLVIPMGGFLVVALLLMLEPDFGTTVLTGTVCMVMLFAGGTRVGYLVVIAVLGVSVFALAVANDPVRMARVLAFLTPEEHADTARQLVQAKLAFMRGGWFGVGLGESMQKHLYLPEPYNDFILAIIGEELGFVGTGIVLLLFLAILICGMVISFRALDPFGRLLAFGVTMMLTIQAGLNVGVVTGCLPTTGLPLPFISYGGSNLLVSVALVCVLLNVAGHCAAVEEDEHTRSIKDRAHRLDV